MKSPDIYIMDVATFGSTCSPASAQYIKNVNAEEFASKYPRAAVAIKDNHYVDDYLDSFASIQEAIEVVSEVKLVHSKGGFTLRRFLSNEAELLRGIGEVAEADTKRFNLERGEKIESVLGLRWIPSEDMFVYTFGDQQRLQRILDVNNVPTKREVASVVMSLFDPLGFIAFFLVHGKILLQDLWVKGTDWDEQIPTDINERWRKWTHLFHQLDWLRIPRCYFPLTFPINSPHLQMHLFVDASDKAYAAVVYFRLTTDGGVQVALVGAKTRVAPIKALSIPRLELKAAVLGARLLETIKEQHNLSDIKRFCWSDAGTMLAWVHSDDHRRFQKFVAVRVGEILTTTQQAEWRWVPSKLNPADAATKWNIGLQLTNNDPWFYGPSFLRQRESEWPQQRAVPSTKEELRPVHCHLIHFTPSMEF